MLDRTPKREGKRSGGWEMRNRREEKWEKYQPTWTFLLL